MTDTIGFQENRIEQLSELSQIGWWEADLKQQHCICSTFICKLLDLREASIHFSEFRNLIHQDYKDTFEKEIQNLISGQIFNQTLLLSLSQGEVWVNVRACIGQSPTGKMFGTLQVVEVSGNHSEYCPSKQNTENMTKELADSEELFRNIFNYIPIGEELYTEDGILYDINPKAMEIFGISRKEDVCGVSLFQNPNHPDAVKEAVRNREIIEFTHSFYQSKVRESGYYESTSDKEQIELYTKIAPLYNYSGAFSGYIRINIDNTEKVSMGKQIWNFEQLFHTISNYAKVGYARYNFSTGKGHAIQQWYENMGEQQVVDLKDIIGQG